jgi:hypothetical protein
MQHKFVQLKNRLILLTALHSFTSKSKILRALNNIVKSEILPRIGRRYKIVKRKIVTKIVRSYQYNYLGLGWSSKIVTRIVKSYPNEIS